MGKRSLFRQGFGLAPFALGGSVSTGIEEVIGEGALAGASNDPVALPERTADEVHTECAAIELALRREVGRRLTLSTGRTVERRRAGGGLEEVFTLDGRPLTAAEFAEYARRSAR